MTKPIKRHPLLQPLSREHHEALMLCFKIREGIKRGIAPGRIENYVSWFWQKHLRLHFLDEETLLFPLLGQGHEQVKKAVEDHQKLKKLIESPFMNTEKPMEIERELEAHIRFEERVLFNTIQETVLPDQLKEIENIVPRAPSCEIWDDPFWL